MVFRAIVEVSNANSNECNSKTLCVSPLSVRTPAGVELYKQEISQALEQAGALPEEAAAALDPQLLVPLEVLDSLEAGRGPIPRAPGSGRVGEGSTTASKGSRFTGLSWSEKLGRWEVREVLCLPACMDACIHACTLPAKAQPMVQVLLFLRRCAVHVFSGPTR